MKKSILNKQQVLAVLVTNYRELQTIFATSPEIDKAKEGNEKKKRILDDLEYLIKTAYKANPEDASIYEIFNS